MRTDVSDAHTRSGEGDTGLIAVLVRLASVLRRGGVEVSMVELVDAAAVLAQVDLNDRGAVRRALALTMAKRADDLERFAVVFDLCFPRRNQPHEGANTQGADNPLDAALVEALRAGSDASFADLAADVVDAFGGVEEAVAVRGERYLGHRILRQLELGALLQRATRLDRGDDRTPFDRRLAALQREARAVELRASIADELRRRLGEHEALEQSLARLADSSLDIDFLEAGPEELEAMRRVLRPLVRRMAARARRRRRPGREGHLDMRRTMRRSLASGGVPLDPALRRLRPARPELVVLCDVSGSMADFARFALSLLQALHAEFSRLRSFVFVDGPEEVSELVRSSPGVIDARLFLARPGAVRDDGHSDYGAALRRLLDEEATALSPQTTVVVCGDARTNYRPARPELVRALRARVQHLYWLDPEPRAQWGSGDSEIEAYAAFCDEVSEVRNLRQLAGWVEGRWLR